MCLSKEITTYVTAVFGRLCDSDASHKDEFVLYSHLLIYAYEHENYWVKLSPVTQNVPLEITV